LRETAATTQGSDAAERELLAALRRGDEAAFASLVDRHHAALVRLARQYVSSSAAAEEVAQDTWLAVLNGIDRFEGRSSLKTWIFRILANRAKTTGQREARSVPFAALARPELERDEPAVGPERFLPAGGWDAEAGAAPASWGPDPERALLNSEAMDVIQAELDRLPAAQRTVLVLRDVEGWPSPEVCNALGISETNQRVLLHRARSKVRQALEDYLG
jgi:RNA polymerase sigma-70 factor (ECF subfamily)